MHSLQLHYTLYILHITLHCTALNCALYSGAPGSVYIHCVGSDCLFCTDEYTVWSLLWVQHCAVHSVKRYTLCSFWYQIFQSKYHAVCCVKYTVQCTTQYKYTLYCTFRQSVVRPSAPGNDDAFPHYGSGSISTVYCTEGMTVHYTAHCMCTKHHTKWTAHCALNLLHNILMPLVKHKTL